MITADVDTSEVVEAIAAIVRPLEDPGEALEKIGAYKLAKVRQVFAAEGPGWPPRAEGSKSYAERARALAVHRVRRKLQRELRRAKGSDDPLRAYRRNQVLKEFERLARGGDPSQSILAPVTARERAVGKERAVLVRELRERKKAGNERGARRSQKRLDEFDAANRDAIDILDGNRVRKSVAGLPGRIARAEKRGAGRLLGRLGSGIRANARKRSLTLAHPWKHAGIHNEGGVAGHGARIPARPFLYWDADDVDAAAEIILREV